jgi:hydrogenase maturation protease
MIIGVGTRWRGDDAAGLEVARRLRGRVAAYQHEGDGAGLVEAWTGAADVVVVDAAASGAAPGTVRRFDARAGPLPARALRTSSHAFGVADAVELARALERLPDHLEVIAIEGADFSAGVPLSAAVERAIDEVVDDLIRR